MWRVLWFAIKLSAISPSDVACVSEVERLLVVISESGEFVVTVLVPGKRFRFGVGGFDAIGLG